MSWIKVGSHFVFTCEKPPRLVAEIMIGNWGLKQQEAHASLIAAAPDMYKAGKGLDCAIGQALMKIAETGLTKEWEKVVVNIILPAQENWRKALAKAKADGKES